MAELRRQGRCGSGLQLREHTRKSFFLPGLEFRTTIHWRCLLAWAQIGNHALGRQDLHLFSWSAKVSSLFLTDPSLRDPWPHSERMARVPNIEGWHLLSAARSLSGQGRRWAAGWGLAFLRSEDSTTVCWGHTGYEGLSSDLFHIPQAFRRLPSRFRH